MSMAQAQAQEEEQINAQVIAVFPDKVRIVVDDLEDFKVAEESLKVGSYVKIADNENAVLIAIIENFQIAVSADGKRDHIIEAFPLGILRDGKFERGGDSLAIPPKEVQPATIADIKKIYDDSVLKRRGSALRRWRRTKTSPFPSTETSSSTSTSPWSVPPAPASRTPWLPSSRKQ